MQRLCKSRFSKRQKALNHEITGEVLEQQHGLAINWTSIACGCFPTEIVIALERAVQVWKHT